MRKKFAKRWRREALCRGALISREGRILTKQEIADNHLKKRDAGFGIVAKCDGESYYIAGYDALDAYRLLAKMLEEDSWKSYVDE